MTSFLMTPKRSVMCIVTERIHFTLRGLDTSNVCKDSFPPALGVCLSSPVDTFYVLGTGEDLFGLTHTSMVFAPAQGRCASIYQLTISSILLPSLLFLMSDGRLCLLITTPCWPTPTPRSCPWACTPGTSRRGQIVEIGRF